MIRLVPLDEIDVVWPSLLEGMQEACRRFGEDITPWHLYSWTRRSDALLFMWDDKAAIIVRPEIWAGQQVVRVLALCGREMADWLAELEASDDWQKYTGSLPVIFEGRKGWERAVPGLKVIRVVYRWERAHGRL